jgi:DNA polymerase-3 subunit gamma/tau
MSQIVLYRKYRSNNFDEIVGQEHVVTTLKNAVKSSEVGHAYLFSGPRGIGKTSFARILSRAVNCLDLQGGYNPCNRCLNCLAFLHQSSLDIVEIDAASHRGIDDIRFLQEGASFAPVSAMRKVFIIDEVHMLTKEAFNALLKTLEEPPAHAMFILATTEIEKVPETIVSRCQTFFLRRLNENEIAGHLQKIALAEGRDLEPEVAKLIAGSVKGGMRDALGVLEQALVFSDTVITKDSVCGVLGLVEEEVLRMVTEMILKGDTRECLKYYLDEIFYQGVDVFRLMKSLEWHWRDELLNLFKEEKTSDKNLEKKFLLMLDELQLARTKQYDIDSLYFEVFLIKVTQRIRNLEDKSNLNSNFPKIREDELNEISENKNSVSDMPLVAEKEIGKNIGSGRMLELTLQVVLEKWDIIVKSAQTEMPLVGSILKMSKILSVDKNKIVLGVSFALQKNQLLNPVNMNTLHKKLEEIFGGVVVVEVDVIKNGDDIKKKQQEIVDNINNQVKQQTGEKLLKDVIEIFDGEII